MPELPEVQAHAERIDDRYAGAVLEGFDALRFTALKTAVPDPAEAVGQRLVFAGRRGKYLLLDFGTATFVIHLMQGGRLKEEPPGGARQRGKAALARWRFEDGRSLVLTEAGTERRAGVWVVAGDPEVQAPLADLGPDADRVDAAALAPLLTSRPGRLHGFLRDQRNLAGLGRRLANEVCHRARLSPFAPTGSLDAGQVARLAEAVAVCINEGLAYERGRDDMSASKERPGAVHRRAGESCPVCGDPVRTVEYRAYTVFYCATCQTGGKVLADNTTSKFLKG